MKSLAVFEEAPASSFIPKMDPLVRSRTDVTEAKRLMEEMGYKGETLHMYVYRNNNEDAMWICRQCAQIGIPIDITIRSESDMMQRATIDEADLILYQICMESNYDLHIIRR